MKKVIIFPRGELLAKDKERLSKEGYVAVEAADPSKVVMLLESTDSVTGDMLLMSAMHGCSVGYPNSPSGSFFSELHRRMKEAEKAKHTTP